MQREDTDMKLNASSATPSPLPLLPWLSDHQVQPATGIVYMSAPDPHPAPEMWCCSFGEELSADATAAAIAAVPALRDVPLQAGHRAWLPSNVAYELLAWCGGNGVSLHVARPRSFEHLMPEHEIDYALVPYRIQPDVANSPPFVRTIRKNDRGELFSLEQGPHGPCGIRRLSLDGDGRDELVAGDAGLWISDPDAGSVDQIVICQCPLDALAFHQAHKRSSVRRQYVALAGPLTQEREALLTHFLGDADAPLGPERPRVVVASGKHIGGRWFAAEITALLQEPVAWLAPEHGRGWFAQVAELHLDLRQQGALNSAATLRR
jgi:hypothetical protein